MVGNFKRPEIYTVQIPEEQLIPKDDIRISTCKAVADFAFIEASEESGSVPSDWVLAVVRAILTHLDENTAAESVGSKSLDELATEIYENSVSHGFWDGGKRNFGEALALMHSELSEALEEDRSGNPVVYLDEKGKPEGAAVELADAAIRVFDWLGHLRDTEELDITVDDLFKLKTVFNAGRAHKHGRAY